MSNVCLVTGANGHLGGNLVRELIAQGETVRAGMRDIQNKDDFFHLNYQVVYTEMQDIESMKKALKGVDILYHVAAVFKHWAKDPINEIVEPNVKGTEIVLKAAADANVKKVVYVSSVAAVGHDGNYLDENNWNALSDNAYYNSKIKSEQKAWELAKKYKLWMVSVLPSAMIGPHANRLTDTMQFIETIRTNKLLVDPHFFFNFVDVRDVAKGIVAATTKGSSGSRYILANNRASSLPEIYKAAQSAGIKLKVPVRLPKWLMYFIALCLELGAKMTGKPAELIRSQVALFYGVRQEYEIAKARNELGYEPRSASEALLGVFEYLNGRQSKI
jgi:dihydroflavonol-4-reductase